MAGLNPALLPGKVRLRVADLGRSLGFYRDVLGLRVAREGEASAVLDADEGGPELLELHEEPGVRPASERSTLGLYHFALLVPDRAELGRVLSRLGDAGVPVGASDHLVSEALYGSDPDGIGVELYRDRPRTEWRYDGGELRMATAPLDLRALLRDATPRGNGDIAAGTRIGHLHLHVADLAGAERFFRDGVGMELTVRRYPGARFFAAGGYHHHVGTNVWAGTDAPPADDGVAGLIDWELTTPTAADTIRIAANLTALGFAPEGRDGAYRVQDPAGTKLRIVGGNHRERLEPTPFSEPMSDDRQTPEQRKRGGFFSSLLGAPFSDNYVVGLVDTPATADTAAEALRTGGFAADDVVVQTGAGLSDQMAEEKTADRLRELTTEEGSICWSYNERAQDGAIVSVYTGSDDDVERARQILAEHGARDLKHFGGWTIRELT